MTPPPFMDNPHLSEILQTVRSLRTLTQEDRTATASAEDAFNSFLCSTPMDALEMQFIRDIVNEFLSIFKIRQSTTDRLKNLSRIALENDTHDFEKLMEENCEKA